MSNWRAVVARAAPRWRRGRSRAARRRGASRRRRPQVAGPHLADRVDRLHGAAAEVVGVLDDDERGLDLVGADAGRHERHRPGRVEQAALARPRAAGDAGERRGRPISARRTWACWSATSSWPGATCRRTPSWLASDPVGAKSPASWPSRSATRSSRARTVGSSPNTSSPTSASRHRLPHGGGGSGQGVGQQVCGVRGHRRRQSCGEHLGDEERQLQALLVVQPRVAHRLVAQVEVGVEDLLRAADALGDVVAGELDVDAAGHRAEAAVHLEEALDLLDDVVEVARLVAATPTRRCCRASGRRPT